jgi:periplasmic copper chaperone A
VSKLNPPITTDDGSITSAISQITWTATAGGTKPGQFQQFDVSIGPLPKASSVSFPAIQTYSDGTVVKWIEKAAPGSKTEPDHPAPTLSLTSAASDPSSKPAATKVEKASTTGPTVLSIIALVVAAAALGLAFVSRARGKTSP